MSIIAISGRMGSGKDTVTKMIQYLMCVKQFGPDDGFRLDSSRNYAIGGWENRKFATKLKLIVSTLIGLPMRDLELQSVKDSELGPEWWYYTTPALDRKRITPTEYEALSESQKTWCTLYKPTVRQLLQEIGTDALRDVVHPNIHVNGLFVDYKGVQLAFHEGNYIGTCKKCNTQMSNVDKRQIWCEVCCKEDIYPNWIISDLRFPNEAQAVVDRQGITLRVERRPAYYISSDDDLLTAAGKQHKEEFLKPHPSETALDQYKFDYVIHNNGTIDDLLEEVRKYLIHFNLI